MPLLLLFYALAVAAILTAAALTYRRLRRFGQFAAISAGLAIASTLLLLWPIPIHGGFTFLGEVAWHEWQNNRRLQATAAAQAARSAHKDRLAARFRGELPIVSNTPVDGRWALITTTDGGRGWHDLASGLIWSDWQPLPGSASLPDLAAARRPCAEHPPAGYWALANEAEQVLLARHGPPLGMPPAPGSVVSYVAEAGTSFELPSYRLARAAPDGATRTFVVRCVARAAGAPARGYVREDIPLAEWNAYQLGKLTPERR